MTEAMFTAAGIEPSGVLGVHLKDEAIGTVIAATLGLPETERGESIAAPWSWEPEGTPDRLYHRVAWAGTYAGHGIRLLVSWHTPLEDPASDADLTGPIPSSDGQDQ